MKAGDVILDTNAVIFLTRSEPAIITELKHWNKFYVSSIVLGELYYGAYKSARISQNLERVEELKSKAILLDCDHVTARFFGKIKFELRAKGCPIPDHDIWIAAVALQYDLPLLTRDKHFDVVSDLQVVTW